MMGTLTSAPSPFDAEAFSPGLLGVCEQILLEKYGKGYALSIDETREGVWAWTVWAPDGSVQATSVCSKFKRSEAIDYLESFLRRL